MALKKHLGGTLASLSIAAAALAAAGTAQAAVVIGTPQAETSTVQDGFISPFTWVFSGLAAGTGMASLQVDFARLDLDSPSGESLRVRVDGTQIGLITRASATSCVEGTDVTFGGFNSDCTGSATLAFDTSFLNDGSLTLVVENNDGVNSLIDSRNGAGWASVAISYTEAATVPEPTSLALVGLALGAVGFARRRKA